MVDRNVVIAVAVLISFFLIPDMNFYFFFADNFHDHVDGPTSPDLPSSAAALLAQGGR